MAEAKRTAARDEEPEGFTDEERAAMKDRAKEVRRGKKKDGTADLLEKIAELEGADRAMAQRLHELITEHAPELAPRTYYGMPAWAKDGKVLCFFQPALKFKTRYATFGFNDNAALDDAELWPTSYALTELTPAAEQRIVELVTRAVG
ncbi:iron chaperone [Agromyces sp. SYSU T00266]|uniref:iron chaperone n=1 Tax=Agromyces zhanjiangensis TaxID=3158562 RepID=UPI0033972988